MAQLLSTGAMNLLRKLAVVEDSNPDSECICKPELTKLFGFGWWLGNKRTTGRYVMELIRLCLVKMEWSDHDEYEIWVISHDGENLLANPDYVPRIVERLTTRG